MRTLRVSLAGTVILALLGGVSGAVVAQDAEDDPDTVTHVTGEAISDRTMNQGAWTEVDGGDQMRGAVFEHDIEWSDPRLPSLMRLHENANVHFIGDDGAAWSWVGNIRLEGEEGAWTGTEYGLGEDSDEAIVLQPRMMLLAGEGAYQGLSAMLQRKYEVITTASRPVFEGYIFEGELPPMPEPLEPLAEESTAATVEPVLLQLAFDGESCTYEGPAELIPGSVELLFHNESEGTAATNMVSIDEGYTIQDVIDDLGPEPSTGHHPSWTREIAGTWRTTAPGESHHWEGDLEMGLYAMVCARLSPLGVWFGTGLTVDG